MKVVVVDSSRMTRACQGARPPALTTMSVPSAPPRRPPKRDQGPRLDPAVERALAVSNFENNYNVEELIGSLSETLIAKSKADPGPFNPEPFLQTFSPALDRLLMLRKQVAERTKRMEEDVKMAERDYGRRLRELDGGFETIGSSFATLETKITDVGRTAIRIGEQLDSLHNTRSLAQSTSLLLSYYLSLSHTPAESADPQASQTPLDALFATRTSRDGRARIAIILRRLMAVAKDVADNAASVLSDLNDPEKEAPAPGVVIKKRLEKEKADRIKDEVERYCENFEKECLRLFDRSYRKGDPRMMAHCAKTLLDFNGGASCVQIYVNQHDFFISKDRVLEEAKVLGEQGEDGEGRKVTDLWLTIADPDAPPPTAEPGLTALFREIRLTVKQEAQIIRAVFPNPSVVMQVFLQRVFAQVIQQHLEHLISRASSISTLATLRILRMTHSLCTALVEDLKAYDFTLGGTLARGAVSGSPNKDGNPNAVTGTPLATMLDRALEEIFVPWLEGARYLESESKALVEAYSSLLNRFTKYHETVLKAKPHSILDRVVNQLSSNTSTSNTSTASAAAAALFKYTGVSTSHNPGSQPRSGADTPVQRGGAMTPHAGQRANLAALNERMEAKTWAADGALTMETAEKILRWHAEAVGRCVELSNSTDVAKNAFALSKILAEAIGRTYVETALESALAKFDAHDAKAEPELSTILVLHPADLICHLWQRYAATALMPLANSSTAVRREMGVFNNHNVVRMEGKVNSVVQRALDAIIAWLGFLLTKQKKADFKPKNDDISFARTTTEPCTLCCEFLDTVRDTVRESLSGKNAEAFLTEVGAAFHSQLLDHFKKFPVNPTGGLMLTKDLATYQESVASFGLPAINDRFDMLRQLGNLFIVQPDVLKSYMTESHLGRLDSRLLRPFLAQRSDYSSFSKSLALDDGVVAVDEEASGPIAGLSILKGSGSRLSGVAGSGMSKLKDMLKDLDNMAIEESRSGTGSVVARNPGPSIYHYGVMMH